MKKIMRKLRILICACLTVLLLPLNGFAAEEARHNDTVVHVDKFFEKYDMKNCYK